MKSKYSDKEHSKRTPRDKPTIEYNPHVISRGSTLEHEGDCFGLLFESGAKECAVCHDRLACQAALGRALEVQERKLRKEVGGFADESFSLDSVDVSRLQKLYSIIQTKQEQGTPVAEKVLRNTLLDLTNNRGKAVGDALVKLYCERFSVEVKQNFCYVA